MTASSQSTSPTTLPVVLTAEDIARLPLEPLDESLPGVTHRLLWRTQDSAAGVMTIEAGHHLGRHAHRLNHHHMWIIDGEAVVIDRAVGAGSYVHVPQGVEHDLDARTTGGCTVFYLYLRPHVGV